LRRVAKLPTRRKSTVLVIRRGPPDELLFRASPSRARSGWEPLSAEVAPGETFETTARRLARDATDLARDAPVDLDLEARYAVRSGPAAGAWIERLYAFEAAPGAPAREGEWLVHYEAKARASTPRVRDAVTRLREQARLRP